MSDHGGCVASQWEIPLQAIPRQAFLGNETGCRAILQLRQKIPQVEQITGDIVASESVAAIRRASRPVGASIRILDVSRIGTAIRHLCRVVFPGVPGNERTFRPAITRHAREHALEIPQRLADPDAAASEAQLTNSALVAAPPFLDHGDRLPDFAHGFEIAQQNNRIGQKAHIDG